MGVRPCLDLLDTLEVDLKCCFAASTKYHRFMNIKFQINVSKVHYHLFKGHYHVIIQLDILNKYIYKICFFV